MLSPALKFQFASGQPWWAWARSRPMQAWVDYFQNVLGIREVLLNLEAPIEAKIAFLSEVEDSSTAATELLDKMILAMKLAPDEVQIRTIALGEISQHIEWLESMPVIVVFSAKIFSFLSSNFPRMKVYLCPSPAEMLKNASLKREAWDILKQVMLKL